MNGAAYLLPLYAFVIWTGATLTLASYIGININVYSFVNAIVKLNHLSITRSYPE
jgi:hypothetical protein